MDYRGYKTRRGRGLSRKQHAPRRSDIIRAIPPGSRRLRGRQIERRYLAAVQASPGFTALRADARDNVMACAKQLARRADYEGGWTRPTRHVICLEAGVSESTWKSCRRRLEAWGLLGTVSPGCKRWAGQDGDGGPAESRNDAAVYVLCSPGRRRESALLALRLSRPPTCLPEGGSFSPRARAPEKGQKGAHFVRPRLRGRPGGSVERDAGAGPGGVVARVLRTGPGQNLTDGWVSHLSGPFLAAGWTAGDLAHAMNHAPDGRQYPYVLENVRSAASWLRWRLSKWLAPGETALVAEGHVAWKHARPVTSPSRKRAETAARDRARIMQLRAERAAAAATWTDPRPHVDRILQSAGLKRPLPERETKRR